MCTDATGPILRPTEAPDRAPIRGEEVMQYLPLFLLFMAVLIAAWFYLQRAKVRDDGTTTVSQTDAPAEPTTTPTAAPTDRPE